MFISRIFVDWNGDTDFSDPLENISESVSILRGISSSIGKDQVRSESPPKVGDFKAILENNNRDFSLENSSSPLAGLLEPGKLVHWEIETEAGTTTIFTGYLEDLLPNPVIGEQTVELPALDALVRLRDKQVSTELLEDVRTDEAIEAVLDAAGWPADKRILSEGGITLEFYWGEGDAFSLIQEIVNTEGAASRWGIDGAGNFIFEDRRYRLTETRSTDSHADFSTSADDEVINISEFGYSKKFKDIINKAVMTVHTRSEQDESVVWSIEEPITFLANETKVFKVSGSDPFKDAVSPSASSGINEVQKLYLTGNPTGGAIFVSFRGASPPPGGSKEASVPIGINNNAATIRAKLESAETIGPGNVAVTGGPLFTGAFYNDVFIEFQNDLGSQDLELLGVTSDLTGGTDPSVVVAQVTLGRRADYFASAGSVSSVSLNRTSGGHVMLEVTAGATGATLDWLQVRAKSVTIDKEVDVENTVDASASITKHGEQRPRGPFRAEISEADALRVANAYVSWFQKSRSSAEIVLDSTGETVLAQMLARAVSDRITVIDAHTGVNGDFWIEQARYELDQYGLRVRFGLEATPEHGDAHTDSHSDSAHSDAGHSDSAHSDTAHSDTGGHSDSHTDTHSDTSHSDSAHSDSAHSDTAHSDSHTDSHTDGAHSDSYSDFHSDDHSDVSHSDVAHSDAGHSDSAHGDTAHSDTHSDVAHTDGHSDFHTDEFSPIEGHSDFHADNHADAHTDTHSDTAHSDAAHSDASHSDSAHSDTAHSDSHSDTAHTDEHSDEADFDLHSDTHSDTAHSDGSHSDAAHSDTAHSDNHSDTHSDADDHGDSHSDAAHSDGGHVDSHSDTAHSDSHTDTAHADSHSDTAHTDTHSDHSDSNTHSDNHSDVVHSDTHSDTAHSDVAHSDTAHGDTHSDAAHGDAGHSDSHTDTAHSDVAHTDVAHGDASHGDSAHSDSHSDDHSDEGVEIV